MDRSEDIMRITLRFNQKIPEQARIIGILKDLNKEYHTTMTSFVIEAITYYIDNIPAEAITNAGKAAAEKRDAELMTRGDVENRLDLYDQALKRWLLESFIPTLLGGIMRPSLVSGSPSFPREGQKPQEKVDLTEYPEIMKDVLAWSEAP